MWRVGATLFALLILVYWGIGLNFSFSYSLYNEQQMQATLLEYLWELPALGVPLAVAIPLLLLRPVARDYDRLLRGEALEDPALSAERLLRYPRRIVWYFTPASILAYLVGNLQTLYFTHPPVEELLKGVPLGLPLGLLFSLASYLALVHYLDPVRRLFVERHGHAPAPRPFASIQHKVVIYGVTIVSLALGLLWLIAYAKGQLLLEDQLQARVEESTLPRAIAVAAARDDPYAAENLRNTHLGPRGYAFVVDEAGVVRSDHPRGARSLADEGWDEVQRGSVVGSGQGRFTDRVETVRLVAFSQVPGTADHVVVVTYRDDFAGPLWEMTLAMGAVTLLGVAVAVSLTVAAAASITRPIRELTEAMRRAKEDGSGGSVALMTDDEVGALAGSYAHMMARLREKHAALQESVARLSQVDVLKTRFMNIASHELRTPMTPIRTELHLIRTGKRGPLTPEQAKGLDMVARNVDRLNRLIRELLEASRMEAGQLRLAPRNLDLHELLAAVLFTMQGEAKAKGVELAAELQGDTLWVQADEDRVTQVLMNLLENAIQFTPAGKRVHVLVAEHEGMARVEVRDEGAGIDPKLLGLLFQPFSQSELGVPRTEGGTGLGLFICRGLIEAHGGRIWASSPGKGQGASFHFTLPLGQAIAPLDAPTPARVT